MGLGLMSQGGLSMSTGGEAGCDGYAGREGGGWDVGGDGNSDGICASAVEIREVGGGPRRHSTPRGKNGRTAALNPPPPFSLCCPSSVRRLTLLIDLLDDVEWMAEQFILPPLHYLLMRGQPLLCCGW